MENAKLGVRRESFIKKVDFWEERLKSIDDSNIYLFAEMIAQSEEAKQILRNKGYGWTGLSLLETVKQEVPNIK